MNPDDVRDGEFYWILAVPALSQRTPQAPMLVVAQACRSEDGSGSGPLRLRFEGCGTDEGVTAVEIIAHVRRPSVT